MFAAMAPLEAQKALFADVAEVREKRCDHGQDGAKLVFVDVKKAHLNAKCAVSLGKSEEPLEFFSHRLQTSMTRATVEARTAELGQTLRSGCSLVGGLSFPGVSALCMNSLAHRLPGGTQAQDITAAERPGWRSVWSACLPL